MRVLELGDYVSAAYCGKQFALWGAEVIKVEDPGGDAARKVGPFKDAVPHPETSALYLSLNGGKRSITLNPLKPAGAALLTRLADACDIIICNLSKSVVERLGLADYATRHPDKVVVAITPFGLNGPYSHFEYTVGVALALGGYTFLMGDPDREPMTMPGWFPDYQAGSYAYVAALASWLGREHWAPGSIIDVCTMEAMVSLHQFTTVMYSYNGVVRTRHGNRYSNMHPICLMPCKDGWIGMCIATEAFWERFCLMVGHPEMASDPRFQNLASRYMYADEIDETIGPWLRERTSAEIFTEGQEVWRLPVGQAMRINELFEDRHLKERQFWQEVDHPVVGPLTYPSSGFRLEHLPPAGGQVPMLGEHNQEIYTSLLGLPNEELTRLRQMGVI